MAFLFAWFKVTGEITIGGGSQTAGPVSITANQPEAADLSGVMNITCELVESSKWDDDENNATPTVAKDLVLSAVEGGNWVTKYTDATTHHDYTIASLEDGQAYYYVYEVKAAFTSSDTAVEGWDELLATYQDKTYSIAVSAQDDSTEALVIWTKGTNPAGDTSGTNNALTKAFYANEAYNFTVNGPAVTMGFVLVYVNGAHASMTELDPTQTTPAFTLELEGSFVG